MVKKVTSTHMVDLVIEMFMQSKELWIVENNKISWIFNRIDLILCPSFCFHESLNLEKDEFVRLLLEPFQKAYPGQIRFKWLNSFVKTQTKQISSKQKYFLERS